MGYACATCGESHKELPRSANFGAPISWSAEEHGQGLSGSFLGAELCAIEEKYFFIKGNIEIPIRESGELFVWTVWVSLSQRNFERARELWNSASRTEEPPYFGWLNNKLPGYPDSLSLKVNVNTRAVGVRPSVELEPTDHPLAVEQREGISLERAQELGELILHPG